MDTPEPAATVWHGSHVVEFTDLLKRHHERGRDTYADQRIAQLVRRSLTLGEGPEEVCEHVRTAAEMVSRQRAAYAGDDPTSLLDDERRLRRASIDLCTSVAAAFLDTSQQVVSALAVADHTLQRRLDALAAVQTINGVANSSLDLGQVLQLTMNAVRQVTHSDMCSIYLYDETRGDLVLRASTGLASGAIGVARLKIGEGITGAAARAGSPLAVRDAWNDPRFKYLPDTGEEPYRSLLCVPVLLFTVPKLIGVLNVQSVSYRDWEAQEVSLLETVAGQVAMAIENARLHRQTDERLRQKVAELTNLRRLSALVASSLDLTEVLDTVLRQLQDLSSADMAAIFERDGPDAFRIVASIGLSNAHRERVRVRYGEAVVGAAARTREPIVVDDALTDPRLRFLSEEIQQEGFRSLLCIPLVTKHGPLGGVCLYTRERHTFSPEEIDVLSAFANEAAMALDNARLYDEVRRGLATKSTLLAELHHRVKNNLQTVAALLMMQQRRARSAEERAAFTESVNRVQSIAAVHDLLSREDIGETGVGEIVHLVATSVTSALSNLVVTVDFAIQAPHALVESQKATVLALVLNELVTNAVVHGFAGRERGRLLLTVSGIRDEVTVTIADDGQGLPAEFDPERDGGLGMQIVRTLVQNDLHGAYALRRQGGGTVATVRFPAAWRSEE